MHQALAKILLRMRDRDVPRPRRMLEDVMTAHDAIQGPACFLEISDQVCALRGVYYTHQVRWESTLYPLLYLSRRPILGPDGMRGFGKYLSRIDLNETNKIFPTACRIPV
jgi:hypothetical protein